MPGKRGVRGLPGDISPEIARLQGIALASVFQTIISEAGRRTLAGQSQAKIADELRPIIKHVLDELDRWFGISPRSVPPKAREAR